MDELKNEERIATADANRLVLTNRRLIYKNKQEYKSIRLDSIAYMEIAKKSTPGILYVTLIINILFPLFFSRDEDGLETAFKLAGGVFIIGVLIYALFQKKTLLIASAGGSIQVNASRMSNDECYRFIEFTEHAINTSKTHVVSHVMHN